MKCITTQLEQYLYDLFPSWIHFFFFYLLHLWKYDITKLRDTGKLVTTNIDRHTRSNEAVKFKDYIVEDSELNYITEVLS